LLAEKISEVYHAPCDVVLFEEDIVQPDIFFISKERENIIREKNIQGAPDFIIEVLSASGRKNNDKQRFNTANLSTLDPFSGLNPFLVIMLYLYHLSY